MLNSRIKSLPLNYNGGHLGFQGFKMLRKNATLIVVFIVSFNNKALSPPPPHDTTLAFITNEPILIIEIFGCFNEIKEYLSLKVIEMKNISGLVKDIVIMVTSE